MDSDVSFGSMPHEGNNKTPLRFETQPKYLMLLKSTF